MNMKSFKSFLVEKDSQKVSVTDRTKDRHAREKDALAAKQSKEVEQSRLQDFRNRENERRAKQKKKLLDRQLSASQKENVETDVVNTDDLNEYLEDGTDELVQAYKKDLPGQ